MPSVEEAVKKIIVEQLGVDADEVTDSASFTDDLGGDSLDIVELVMAFEEEFDIEIPDEEAEKIADPGITEDAVAVQLPVQIPAGAEKPYFGMGDRAHPVNIWQWKSGAVDGTQQRTPQPHRKLYSDAVCRFCSDTG